MFGHLLGWYTIYTFFGAAPPRKEEMEPATFRPTFLWHGRPSQQLLSSCYFIEYTLRLLKFINKDLLLLQLLLLLLLLLLVVVVVVTVRPVLWGCCNGRPMTQVAFTSDLAL